MKVITLNYSTTMPEDRIFAFSRMLGYLGEDLSEAISFIDNGFLNHITPWMVTLIDHPSKPDIRESFKKRIMANHTIQEI